MTSADHVASDEQPYHAHDHAGDHRGHPRQEELGQHRDNGAHGDEQERGDRRDPGRSAELRGVDPPLVANQRVEGCLDILDHLPPQHTVPVRGDPLRFVLERGERPVEGGAVDLSLQVACRLR